MVVPILIAALSIQQADSAQQPAAKVSAAALIGKAIARYVGANTIVGTITMTQTAEGKSIVMDTGMQIEKPMKARVQQTQRDNAESHFLLTSDGKLFSYDPPHSDFLKLKRNVEAIPPKNIFDQPFSLGDIYIASCGQLLDKSIWLDMAFGETSHLKAMKAHWATLEYRGKVKVRGMDVDAVSGAWRDNMTSPPMGDFEMYIDADANIVRYVTKYRVVIPETKQKLEVTTIWDADLKIGQPVDQTLFTVVR